MTEGDVIKINANTEIKNWNPLLKHIKVVDDL